MIAFDLSIANYGGSIACANSAESRLLINVVYLQIKLLDRVNQGLTCSNDVVCRLLPCLVKLQVENDYGVIIYYQGITVNSPSYLVFE